VGVDSLLEKLLRLQEVQRLYPRPSVPKILHRPAHCVRVRKVEDNALGIAEIQTHRLLSGCDEITGAVEISEGIFMLCHGASMATLFSKEKT
jgi:hypothetical protein